MEEGASGTGGNRVVGFSTACWRANSCAGVGAPQPRRGSDIQIWAGLPCGLGDTLQPTPPPLYSSPARSLGMALKKEIKFPPESKAPYGGICVPLSRLVSKGCTRGASPWTPLRLRGWEVRRHWRGWGAVLRAIDLTTLGLATPLGPFSYHRALDILGKIPR